MRRREPGRDVKRAAEEEFIELERRTDTYEGEKTQVFLANYNFLIFRCRSQRRSTDEGIQVSKHLVVPGTKQDY